MKNRLLILLVVFVVGLAGVGGFYWYLDSQIPKGDPQYDKEPATDFGDTSGGMPQAPGA